MPNLRRGMMAAAGAGGGATNTPFTDYYYGVWGSGNTYGWMGQNDTASYTSPVQIGDHLWKYMKGGTEETNTYLAGVKTDGTLWMCGLGNKGQLGQGNTTNYSSPVQVGSLTDWFQMGVMDESGGSTAAVKTDGTLWTWGEAEWGTHGDGTATNRSSPVQVGSLTDWGDGVFSIENIKRLAGGGRNVGCVKKDGTLWLWGANNEGQTGQGSTTPTYQSSTVQLGSATNWLAVDCGREYMAFLNADGQIWGCGSNTKGELGDGTSTARSSPVQAGSATDWVFIAGLRESMSAINSSGELYTWGMNFSGQLGLGDTTHRCVPTQVGALTDWKYVSGGNSSMTGVKTDGTCWTWGEGNKRPAVTDVSSPVQVGSRTDYTYTFKPGGSGGNVGSATAI